jgi:hypothetical protein
MKENRNPNPNASLEQRIAALESTTGESVRNYQSLSRVIVGLMDVSLGLKKDLTSMLIVQGNLLKLFMQNASDIDQNLVIEITTLLRRGESEIDQSEAKYADFQKQVDEIKRKLPPPNS